MFNFGLLNLFYENTNRNIFHKPADLVGHKFVINAFVEQVFIIK